MPGRLDYLLEHVRTQLPGLSMTINLPVPKLLDLTTPVMQRCAQTGNKFPEPIACIIRSVQRLKPQGTSTTQQYNYKPS